MDRRDTTDGQETEGRTMSNTDILTYLLEVRQLLARRGAWIQGRQQNEDNTAWCLVGAVREMARKDDKWNQAEPVLITLADHLPVTAEEYYASSRLMKFNDTKNRRKREVLALIDKAIASEERKSSVSEGIKGKTK